MGRISNNNNNNILLFWPRQEIYRHFLPSGDNIPLSLVYLNDYICMRARLLQFIVVAVRVVLLSLPISMSAAMKANGYDVVVCPDTAGLKKYIAERVAHIAQRAISERGVFTIALSGGSMPNLLSELPNQSNVSWSDWRVFFADERCVPLDHDDSNYKACQQNLFDKIPIPPEHIYSIDNIEDPNLAALSYESRLRAVVPGMSLDLAMLGLGPDGHTASLFPGHELLEYNGERAVMPIFDSPKPPSERITLTLSTLRQCKKVRLTLPVACS